MRWTLGLQAVVLKVNNCWNVIIFGDNQKNRSGACQCHAVFGVDKEKSWSLWLNSNGTGR